MKVSLEDIKKLRALTSAGMSDCKKALEEAEGDFDKAVKLVRERGLAIAAKRSDRETSEGCVLAKSTGTYAAMIALKCETEPVAKNADFIALTNEILDLAMANKCQSMEEVKALKMGDTTVEQAVMERSGVTGEKLELDGYLFVEGAYTAIYNHQGKNQLCTIAAFNEKCEEKVAHEVCMQIAAMAPIALTEADVPANILATEREIAIEKARQEGKPENLLERIAEGRITKFYQEACLLKQESIMDPKKTVAEVLKVAQAGLTVVAFRRFTLRAE